MFREAGLNRTNFSKRKRKKNGTQLAVQGTLWQQPAPTSPSVCSLHSLSPGPTSAARTYPQPWKRRVPHHCSDPSGAPRTQLPPTLPGLSLQQWSPAPAPHHRPLTALPLQEQRLSADAHTPGGAACSPCFRVAAAAAEAVCVHSKAQGASVPDPAA